jgi:hypothetical protein
MNSKIGSKIDLETHSIEHLTADRHSIQATQRTHVLKKAHS